MEQRIIKFRAKRLGTGEWMEGDLLHHNNRCYIGIHNVGYNIVANVPIEVNPSTVCQFTGLKDKNGKEIWEHDILTDTDDATLGEVTFDKGAFVIDGWSLSEYEDDDEELYLAVVCSKFDRKEGK